MARNLTSKFNFNADEGLGFATINNINPEKEHKETDAKIEKTEKSAPIKKAVVEKIEEPAKKKQQRQQEIEKENNSDAEKTDYKKVTKKGVYAIDSTLPVKDQNLYYHQDDCTPKVASLLEENMRYIRIRSKKLGIPMNLYVNIIIDEYRSNIVTDNLEQRYSELYGKLTKNYKGSKVRTNFFLIKENADFIEDEIINIGCQPSQYFNFLISNEREREEKEGARI